MNFRFFLTNRIVKVDLCQSFIISDLKKKKMAGRIREGMKIIEEKKCENENVYL